MAVLLGLALVALVAVIWVPPIVAGPTIDCGGWDEVTCADVVSWAPADASRNFPLGALMPITKIVVLGECSYAVDWLFWGTLIAQC